MNVNCILVVLMLLCTGLSLQGEESTGKTRYCYDVGYYFFGREDAKKAVEEVGLKVWWDNRATRVLECRSYRPLNIIDKRRLERKYFIRFVRDR